MQLRSESLQILFTKQSSGPHPPSKALPHLGRDWGCAPLENSPRLELLPLSWHCENCHLRSWTRLGNETRGTWEYNELAQSTTAVWGRGILDPLCCSSCEHASWQNGLRLTWWRYPRNVSNDPCCRVQCVHSAIRFHLPCLVLFSQQPDVGRTKRHSTSSHNEKKNTDTNTHTQIKNKSRQNNNSHPTVTRDKIS